MTTRPISNLVATWSSAGIQYTGIGLNVTSYGYATGSKILNLNFNTNSVFSIDASGAISSPTINSIYSTVNTIYSSSNSITTITSTLASAYNTANLAYAQANTGGGGGVGAAANLANVITAVTLANVPFYEASAIIKYPYTITTGMNAFTPGPVAIAAGVTVTVPPGSTWTIL